MLKKARNTNFFEKALLIIGLGVGVAGFILIKNLYLLNPVVSWELVIAVFLWLSLIVMLILTATMEDVKEELAIVIREGNIEARLMKEELAILKQISNEQLEELRLIGQKAYGKPDAKEKLKQGQKRKRKKGKKAKA